VSTEARAFGVARHENTEQAKLKCPDVCVLRYPRRKDDPEKPDITIHKKGTQELLEATQSFCNGVDPVEIRPWLEANGSDEIYLDVTALADFLYMKSDPSFNDLLIQSGEIDSLKYKFMIETEAGPVSAVQFTPKRDEEIRLYYGLQIAAKLVQLIKEKTALKASAGIGHNKLQAKLACGVHKPMALTVILPSAFEEVSKRIEIPKVPGLGGVAGKAILEQLEVVVNEGDGDGDGPTTGKRPVQYLWDLRSFTSDQIAELYTDEAKIKLVGSKNAGKIYRAVHGICESIIPKPK